MTKFASVDDYSKVRKKDISKNYFGTFLNLEQITDKIRADVLASASDQLRDDLIWYILKKYWLFAIVAMLALVLLIGFGVSKIGAMFSQDEIKSIVRSAILEKSSGTEKNGK